jgi:hypothetical protein
MYDNDKMSMSCNHLVKLVVLNVWMNTLSYLTETTENPCKCPILFTELKIFKSYQCLYTIYLLFTCLDKHSVCFQTVIKVCISAESMSCNHLVKLVVLNVWMNTLSYLNWQCHGGGCHKQLCAWVMGLNILILGKWIANVIPPFRSRLLYNIIHD